MKETLIAILTAALLLAQNPQDGGGPGAKAPTKFSITTQLVTIGLTAKDKDGKPITGLTAADFVVRVDLAP